MIRKTLYTHPSKRPKSKPMQRPEQALQIAIMNKLRAEMRLDELQKVSPRFVCFHPSNGGYRTQAEAQIFVSMGVMAGVSDIIVLIPNGLFIIELKWYEKWKREPDRVPTEEECLEPSQITFRDKCKKLNIPWYMLAAHSLDDGIKQLREIFKEQGIEI